jgi:branched-chain amino acid transport system permease protein
MPEQNSKVWRTLQQYGFTPIAIVAFVLMFLVPFVVHDEFLLRLLIVGLIYACLAMGFDFTAGFINIVNFGYAAFMGLGAYTSAILAVKFGLSPFIGFLVAPLVTAVAGLLTGLLTLCLRGIFAAVFTWFVGLALMSVCANWVSLTKGHNGLSVPYLFSDPSNKPYYFVIALLCLITWVIMNRFARGHAGLTYKAIGDDMNAAMAAGINPTSVNSAVVNPAATSSNNSKSQPPASAVANATSLSWIVFKSLATVSGAAGKSTNFSASYVLSIASFSVS